METILVALGGNALIQPHEVGNFSQQMKNARETCRQLASLVKKGHGFVLTHGNGPQVGNLEIRMSLASKKIPPMPLYVDVGMTQAQIGYMLQQNLRNFILGEKVATVVTEVLVDKRDPAFRKPSKPIGPFYKTRAEAKKAGIKKMVEDSGRGYRKVVASPMPKKIVQLDSIKKLMGRKSIVIACGGGGIPVVKRGKKFGGIEAVIDKDHCARLLANSLKLKTLVILTDVEFAYLNYRKKNMKKIRKIKAKELKKHLREGHFAPGSMHPKIESAIDFLSKGGTKVIITSLNKLVPAMNGKTGTIITK